MTEETLKISLLGDKGIGKTRCILQLTSNTFEKELHDSHASEEVHYFEMKVDGKKCCLMILDTSTNPDYHLPDREDYINSSDGYVIMYGIDVKSSFPVVWNYRDKILQSKGLKETDRFPLVIAANKADIDIVREVSKKEGEALASAWHAPFFEFSSKDHKAVENMWAQLVREIRKSKKK